MGSLRTVPKPIFGVYEVHMTQWNGSDKFGASLMLRVDGARYYNDLQFLEILRSKIVGLRKLSVAPVRYNTKRK
jgi:hypothetical protein